MSTPLRVRHLLSPKKISLSDFIFSQLEISSEKFFELLDLGAIYLNQKRCLQEQVLNPGDYVRVHMSPKRFPTLPQSPDQCVVAWEKNFVVFNKPQGFPCHALVDNQKENLLTYFQNHFKCEFFLTHRLDIGTGGLWVLARTKEYQSQFNRMLQSKSLQKFYFARVEGSWSQALGLYTHYMKPALRAPREVFEKPDEGFLECQLEILHVTENGLHSDLDIQLHTGRTHQIRSQLSYLGHPIWGDQMYGSPRSFGEGCVEKWALWSRKLIFEDEKKWQFNLPFSEIENSLATFKS